MPRDFLLLVFFINQFPPSLRVHIGTVSNFFENSRKYLQLKVDHRCRWHQWQMKKIFNQKNFNNFVGTPLDSRVNIYIHFCLQVHFKVDGNEKLGRSKGRQPLNFSPALWRLRVILNLNISFLCKQYISVSAYYSLIYRRCLDELAKRCKFWRKGRDHHNANSIGADVFISWKGEGEQIWMNIRFTWHHLIKKSINCANTVGAVINETTFLPRFSYMSRQCLFKKL